jgi:DNA-binding Lrp family transcriptional regulator
MLNCDIMVEAVVLINTDIESPQDQVFENLKEINGVDKAYNTNYGVYDFVAEVQTKTIDELKTSVLQHIRKLDSVDSTTALVVAKK